MAKNRKTTNGTSTTGTADMSMNGKDSVTGDANDIVDEQATVQPTRDDKVKEELNDLYGQVYEAQMDRDTTWGAYYSSLDKVNNLKAQLDALSGTSGAQVNQIRKQLSDAQKKSDDIHREAMTQQKRLEEINTRIHELETGYTTGDNSSVIAEIESGEDEHEL